MKRSAKRRHPSRELAGIVLLLVCFALVVGSCQNESAQTATETEDSAAAATGETEESATEDVDTSSSTPTTASEDPTTVASAPGDARQVAEAYLEAVLRNDREAAKPLIAAKSLETRGGIIDNTDLWKALMDASLPLEVREVKTQGSSGYVMYGAGATEYRVNLVREGSAWRISFGEQPLGAEVEGSREAGRRGPGSSSGGRRSREEGPPGLSL
jgi:hypothetical protein